MKTLWLFAVASAILSAYITSSNEVGTKIQMVSGAIFLIAVLVAAAAAIVVGERT